MKKAAFGLISGVLVFVPVFAFADHNTAHTIQQLLAQVQVLQEQLKSLQAQTSVVQPSASTGVSKTMSVFDDDTSDDDVIQLNNLRMQAISLTESPSSGGVLAILQASYDFGVNCKKFSGLESATGTEITCPLSPSTVYQIRVDGDTRLLLRNRQKATLGNFDVGDLINVYGFMDRDTRNVDALVVRNLDKPASKKFIQLNNVEVVSPPSSSRPPATFTVVQKISSPCFDYGVSGIKKEGTIPCPPGLEAAGGAGKSSSQSGTLSYPQPRKYLIEVTGETLLLQRDKTPLALGDVTAGDTLNIYGVENREGGIAQAIRAITVRDLSKPAKVGTGILQVTVTDAEIVCAQSQTPTLSPGTVSAGTERITSPCGVIYNATVLLYGENGAWVGSKTTSGAAATFENLREGTYRAVVSASGYGSAEQKADVKPGQVSFLSIALRKLSQKITIHTKSDLRGTVGEYFSAAFLGDGGSPSYTWTVTSGSLPPGLQLVAPPLPAIACFIDPATANKQCPEYKQTSIWLQGMPTAAGSYKFELTAKDSAGNVGTASFVSVVSPAVVGVGVGWLTISPSGATIAVGGMASFQAIYQPPMPLCPAGTFCAQVMPSSYPVEATWRISDPAVASVSYKQSPCSAGIPATNAGCFDLKTAVVTGLSAGSAEVKASFSVSSGNNLTATAKVNVTTPPTSASGM